MIRNAVEKDASGIQLINKEQLGYDYPINKTINNLKRIINDHNHHLIMVFEDNQDNKIYGYIHAEVYEETYADPQLNILGIAVSKSHQKRGIGSQLLSDLENKGREKGFSGIRLTSGENRIGAHKFYEKLGYINNKIQKRFFKSLN